MIIKHSGATVELGDKPLLDWESASQEEIIEQVLNIHRSINQSVQLQTFQIPMRVYKMLAFTPCPKRVRKGPGKGKLRYTMVKK